jgi:hypothetical protein
MNNKIPSSEVQERYGEALVQMQVTKEEKAEMRKRAADPVLVVATQYYHNGHMGKFLEGNVYAIPKILFEELKHNKGKSFTALKAISRKDAEKQLKTNKRAAAKHHKERYEKITGETFPSDVDEVGPIPGGGDDEKDTKSPEDRSARSPRTK